MGLKLLSIASLLLASCVVMILHEIPKTVLFFYFEKKPRLGKNLRKSYQFIDPIGLIFSLTGFCGFSKSYMLRTKRDKNNLYLGLAGFIMLLLLTAGGFLICRFAFIEVDMSHYFSVFWFMFFQYISITAFGMFFVNLFPLMTFDMGLVIAAKSREKYFSIIRNDYLIKMIFILCALLGIIRSLCINSFLFFYQM
ncbi:MAG: hypothetical protein PWP24_1915 [Clostridiales bacterium]|nr:hypothetical protein [Clostridiales bacterium]